MESPYNGIWEISDETYNKIMKMILLNMATNEFECWEISHDYYAHILISVTKQLSEIDSIRVSRKLKSHPETVDRYHFYLSPVEDIYSNIIIYNENNEIDNKGGKK